MSERKITMDKGTWFLYPLSVARIVTLLIETESLTVILPLTPKMKTYLVYIIALFVI